jgi:predicted CXXCH cytochrome family protein
MLLVDCGSRGGALWGTGAAVFATSILDLARPLRLRLVLAAVLGSLLMVLVAPGEALGQAAPRTVTNCVACHGEMELIRQHVESPARARELIVTLDMMRSTGHGDMQCAECHSGYSTFPHVDARTQTSSCASCHEPADEEWAAGQHAVLDAAGETSATCTACHGAHGVATAEQLAEPPARREMNARCVACHQTEILPASDPHSGEVGCWACHAPHLVHPVDDPEALVAPARQASTCGACHDEAFANWDTDAHGDQVRTALASPGAVHLLPLTREVPTCSGCHGGHGMIASDVEGFPEFITARCSDCHEHHASTFFGTYHGKATALGSRVSASCADCHGSHLVFAQDDPRSMVHEANLVETCGACHPNARPAFVKYDSHPELLNWRRNPVLTGSFVFMNALLVFVLFVFGMHTLLWWVRLIIDKRRGIVHGPGAHGGHGSHEPADGGAEGAGHRSSADGPRDESTDNR